MKLNKLRTRFSYHKKKNTTSERDCKKLQLVFRYFYSFRAAFCLATKEGKNVCREIGEWKKNKKPKKHENSLNGNKLKSCRKILTCRSRYSAFSFGLVFVAVFSSFLPFNSFKRILNHFPAKWNDSISIISYFSAFSSSLSLANRTIE